METQMLYLHRDAQYTDGGQSTNSFHIQVCIYGEFGGTLKPTINQVTYTGNWKLVGSGDANRAINMLTQTTFFK
jgi:hypothetical protein